MNSAVDGRESTGISALPSHILQSHIFNLLDGRSLASVCCVSRNWRFICSENKLWEIICSTLWPSIPGEVNSSYRYRYRSLFSDCVTVSCPLLNTPTCNEKTSTTELISAVDVYCDDVALYSKNFKTETLSGNFLSSPFEMDLLDPNEKVATPLTFNDEDEEECMEEAKQRLRISWILIDPSKKRAFNVCGYKPVEVHRHWSNGFIQLRYATVVHNPSDGELVQCNVVVICGGNNGGGMEVLEVNMHLEDLNGNILVGDESLVVIGEAMEGRRRMGDGNIEKERYRVLLKKRIDKRVRRTEVRKRSFDWATAAIMAAGVCIITIVFCALLAGRR